MGKYFNTTHNVNPLKTIDNIDKSIVCYHFSKHHSHIKRNQLVIEKLTKYL